MTEAMRVEPRRVTAPDLDAPEFRPEVIPYKEPDIYHTDAQSKPKRPDI